MEFTGLLQELSADRLDEAEAVSQESFKSSQEQAIWKSLEIFKFTEKGKTEVNEWIENFVITKNKNNLVKQYAQVDDAGSFFINPVFKSPKLLLDVLTIILNHFSVSCSSAEETAGLNSIENDTIEYLGGYLIKKAAKKFNYPYVTSLFTQDRPSGEFIVIMEKFSGALNYPSTDFLNLLQIAYLSCSKESFKNPRTIDFNLVTCTVYNHSFFNIFMSTLCARLQEQHNEEVHSVLVYIIDLFVRVLSYTFAQRLFQKLFFQSNKQCKGLRGELKKKF